jgi:hypothetical protein
MTMAKALLTVQTNSKIVQKLPVWILELRTNNTNIIAFGDVTACGPA